MDREAHLQRLKDESFDVLVIGGGATGAGVALDAATRGLKVAMVERDDFAAGTSSRSTKLIHGGVRYLEKAIKHLDRTQWNLVRDGLKERAVLLKIAPHLARPMPILTPIYNLLEVPYITTGLKIYDRLAGKANIQPSRFLGPTAAKEQFPMLKKEGLRGAVVYYDGQFDDARMNLAIVLTAAEQGAATANHVEVTGLTKENGKLSGVKLRDRLSDDEWDVSAKVVINATGPFTDKIRFMDDPNAQGMLEASSGVHIVLDQRFSPPETGLLIPETDDGRVLFLLPWLNHTLVGTTDKPADIEDNPKPKEEDIQYILDHIERYFDVPVKREDVLSSWSGLRPLVSDPEASDTAGLSRDHVVNISDSGLLTIAGGKWTSYRKMSLDAVNEAVKLGNLNPARESQTETLKLVGADKFTDSDIGKLQQNFDLAADVAEYLNRAYGDRAANVAALATNGLGKRLVQGEPFLEAEVVYSAKHEGARSATDFLARRTRIGFLNEEATKNSISRVTELLAETLKWDSSRAQRDREAAQRYFA